MPSPLTRAWTSDAEYIAAQDKESSWSHASQWGVASAQNFVSFGRYLGTRLFHDDHVADFGGNDGTAANAFYRAHGIRPVVVDCEPKRLAFAREIYGLRTVEAFLEDLPLESKSIEWGFCSHTLEHVRDQRAALSELRRVVRFGCGFVFPLEHKHHAEENHAHTFHCTTLRGWKRLLQSCGWHVKESKRHARKFEVHFFAEPE